MFNKSKTESMLKLKSAESVVSLTTIYFDEKISRNSAISVTSGSSPLLKNTRLPPIIHPVSKKKKKQSPTAGGKKRKASHQAAGSKEKEKKMNASPVLIVEPVSLHKTPSSTLTSSIKKKKEKKTAKFVKESVETLYTRKAIKSLEAVSSTQHQAESYSSANLIKYRSHQEDLVGQQNVETVREHWKTHSRTKTRSSMQPSVQSLVFEKPAASFLTFPKKWPKSRKQKQAQTQRQKKLQISEPSLDRASIIASTASISSIAFQKRRSISQDLQPQSRSSKTNLSGSKKSSICVPSVTKRADKVLQRKRVQEMQLQFIIKSLEEFQRFHKVAGVRAIDLSNSTQNVLGIKQKIDLVNPWFCVDTDRLLDNMKLVKKYNEALSILEVIVPYTESNMLLGYFPYPNMFLVCTNPEAKDLVITMLESDLLNDLNMLQAKICRTPFRWLTFGSEKEIDRPSSKPLIQVHVSIIHPLANPEGVKFRMRMVEQAKDGYVELIIERKIYNNVLRRKLDASVQTNKSNISIGTSIANKSLMKDKGIQYYYNNPCQQQLNPRITKQLEQFLRQQYDLLKHTFLQNTCMFIHSKDYEQLGRQLLQEAETPRRLAQFWDARYCRNKTVRLVTWNPWLSGVVAVVYSETHTMVSAESFQATNQQEENYVLIWTYESESKPHQLLFSEKVISIISFCPLNKRIIIGIFIHTYIKSKHI